ncbi:MAG TPA: metal-dependent hydrolase [Candidatus Krumholzibacteriaceae bacterium]|nr:metal-dependent hydrolase [Candidatus Krumholzibacteriaceae bacterium]
MFAVGHLALGYILAKTTSKALRTKINLPLIFFLSVLPDIDVLIPNLNHRGPLHSIIVITLAFIPFFLYYKKQVAPSYVAIVQHSLIGDYFSGGGVQLLWPLATGFFGLNLAPVSQASISVELISFIFAVIILLVTKDMTVLLKPKKENLFLLLPEGAILGSIFLSLGFGLSVELLVAHLLFFTIFAVAILTSLKSTV